MATDDDTPDDLDVDQAGTATGGNDLDDDKGSDQLADAGKQALDRMKAERNAARAEARAFKALGLSVDQIKALQQTSGTGGKGDDKPDVDKLLEQARSEARAEATAAANRERVVDKIEAKAARAFADPEDAVAILLRSRPADDFLDGDKIDVQEIQDALTELLEKKPHLAAAQGSGRRFQGSADQGPRKEKPPTLDDQIAAAEKAGDARAAIALKSQRLVTSDS